MLSTFCPGSIAHLPYLHNWILPCSPSNMQFFCFPLMSQGIGFVTYVPPLFHMMFWINFMHVSRIYKRFSRGFNAKLRFIYGINWVHATYNDTIRALMMRFPGILIQYSLSIAEKMSKQYAFHRTMGLCETAFPPLPRCRFSRATHRAHRDAARKTALTGEGKPRPNGL